MHKGLICNIRVLDFVEALGGVKDQPIAPWKKPPVNCFGNLYCGCIFPGTLGIDVLLLVLLMPRFSGTVSLQKSSYTFFLPSKFRSLFCSPTHHFTIGKYIKYFPRFLFCTDKCTSKKLKIKNKKT